MIYYKSVKITIDVLGLAKVIINVIMYYYNIPKLIVINQNFYLYQIFDPHYAIF